jgi:hypothetical protein
MRRAMIVLLAAAMMLVVAASSAGASPAVHSKTNTWMPLAGFQVFVPCTGDTITFTQGSLHDIAYFTVNGSQFSITNHDQPSNLKGADTSGRTYEGVGVTRTSASGSLVNGQFVDTYVNNFNMVGTGGAPSFKTHETIHVTITPSGVEKVFFDHLRATCG